MRRFLKDIKSGLLVGWTIGIVMALLYVLIWFISTFPIIGSLCVAVLILWALGAVYNLWEEL